MSVEELIAELQKVQDKTQDVALAQLDGNYAACDTVYPLNGMIVIE